MLNDYHFEDKDEGIKKVSSIIKSHVEIQGGNFISDISEEEAKKVWYLDTKNYEFKDNGLLIRVKENSFKSEYKVEFKIRSPNRDKAASYDLSHPKKNSKYDYKGKHKFEEDITTPFNNVFSVSSLFKYDDKPDLNSYNDIKSIYPLLNLDISDKNENLVKVNDFEANEFNPKIGEIEFANGKVAQTQLSIWYLPNNDLPCIVEFDIDVNADEQDKENENTFEEFPQSKIEEINKLYNVLQAKNIGIANLETTKTKTQFVYWWKNNK